MLTSDGWFDWALRDPGPVGSVNGGVNGGKGIVPHSAEGHFSSLQALHDFHWSRATHPTSRASWGATNLVDGRFVQHYSVWEQTWTSGSGYPNNNFFAFENEGMAGEPLTDAQTANIVRVCRDLMPVQGWTLRRPTSGTDKTATGYEHNECTRWGSMATSCPSGRIPWDRILAELNTKPEEDDEMKPQVVWNTTLNSTWIVGFAAPILLGDANEVAQAEKVWGKQIALSDRTIQQMKP